jgi:hypothetical protein
MNHRRRVRAELAVSALVVLGTAALLATGAAGERLKTKSQTVEVDGAESETATAKCKRGTRAISGGFETEPFQTGGISPWVLPYESQKGGRRSWKATGANAASEQGELTSYAYCRDEKVKSRSDTAEVEGSSGGDFDTGSATARCPRELKAVSGGFDNPDFSIEGGALIFPYESVKQGGRKWTASGQNLGMAEGDVLAQVNCREGERLKTRKESETIASLEAADVAVKCKRGDRVVSGGFAIENPFSTAPDYGPYVYASRKQGKRTWVTSFFGYSPGSEDVTAYAYCEEA